MSEQAAGAPDRPAGHFDIRAFARTAAGSHRDVLCLEAYAEHPLSADTLRTLSFLHNTERATMTYLRSVLVTATHKDARITAFLTTWAFEKYWIADALGQIVKAHDPEAAVSNDNDDHATPIRESIVGNVVGVPMIGVHMALCTIDEWVTQAAYARLAEIAGHEQLSDSVARFLDVKARHVDFLEAQARHRLSGSRTSRTLARRRNRRTRWPIGAADQPRAEQQHFFNTLLADRPDLVAGLDARIDGLPGLDGLALISKAVAG